jgi:hypothetical protein
MPHIVDNLLNEAQAAISEMRESALRARILHARAELLRHMRGTAAKNAGRRAAAAKIADEWMRAWGLGADAYPDLAGPFRDFTKAFCVDAEAPSASSSIAIGEALDALEAALAGTGTTLADQMAFRSHCAHGWWEMVVPVPSDPPRGERYADIPSWRKGVAFWDIACAPRCSAAADGAASHADCGSRHRDAEGNAE